jgi:hypothetical protein
MVIKMHEMPPSRPRGCVQANYQHLIPTCNSCIALCTSRMNEIKKCFDAVFGWICALNRWSVQEHAQTSFCPVTPQAFN